jgi:hypothetical protein
MPPRLVHCRECRALLNTDLESDSIEIPEFQPLQELDSLVELTPRGFYISCPLCDRELKINRKYQGKSVECASCKGTFQFEFRDERITKLGYYVDCPQSGYRPGESLPVRRCQPSDLRLSIASGNRFWQEYRHLHAG